MGIYWKKNGKYAHSQRQFVSFTTDLFNGHLGGGLEDADNITSRKCVHDQLYFSLSSVTYVLKVNEGNVSLTAW